MNRLFKKKLKNLEIYHNSTTIIWTKALFYFKMSLGFSHGMKNLFLHMNLD